MVGAGVLTGAVTEGDAGSTLGDDGNVKNKLLRRIQGNPLPTATDTEPRIAAFSEYGAGGPSRNVG